MLDACHNPGNADSSNERNLTMARFTKTDMTFKQWMEQVDFWCNRDHGLSVNDLPDCCFSDWYDDDVSPRTACKRAIKAAKDE